MLYCLGQCKYPCIPVAPFTSSPHNISSTPLAFSPNKHRRINGYWREKMSPVAMTFINPWKAIGRAGDPTSDILSLSPSRYRLGNAE